MTRYSYPVRLHPKHCIECRKEILSTRRLPGSRHPARRCIDCHNRRASELFAAFKASPPTEPLNAQQIADRLGAHPSYVAELIRLGKLKGVKVERRETRPSYIVQPADLIAFVQAPWNLARTEAEMEEPKWHTCAECGEVRRLEKSRSCASAPKICRACNLDRQRKLQGRLFNPPKKEPA